MLQGAERAPIHLPPGASRKEGTLVVVLIINMKSADLPPFFAEMPVEVDDEEAMLKKLQAELAM